MAAGESSYARSHDDQSDGRSYQCVQLLRSQLKAAGIDDSWTRLRATLSVQRRVTASLRRKDGRTVHVRKSTVTEPAMMAIYQALVTTAATRAH